MSAKARWLAIVITVGVALDQATKQLARAYLRGRGPVSVIDGFFQLRYAENPGMAFSLGGSRALLIGGGLVILTILSISAWRGDRDDRRLAVGLGLIMAGAVGNMIDRIFVGRVVDFVLWRAGDLSWPLFNVADALLVVGLAALLLVRAPKKARA
jgi:signal peptidase II